MSSNINEVIKTVIIFFYDKILYIQKAQKEYKAPKDSFKLFIFSVKKLSCLNDSDPTKLVKVHIAIRTKSSLVGPVKKLNYLNNIKTSFLRLFKLLQKDFARTKSTKSTKSIKTQPSKSTKHE